MSNTLPITIQMGALPSTVRWTPQQLADAMVERMSLVTSQTFALFVTGSTAPTSNVGPWLKNGNEWWVWSNSDGAYVPIEIVQASLGYIISSSAPDPTIYQFWIETAPGGSPLSIKIYYNSAWTDVYATALVAALAPYSTTTQMNAAIAAAVAGATFPSYPAQAVIAGSPQVINVDATPHKVLFTSDPINPAPAPFVIATSRYVAPANGVYSISMFAQFDNNTGVAATMQVLLAIYKNGVDTGKGGADETPNPPGSRWFPTFGGILLELATNDYVEVWASLQDGTNTGNVDLTATNLNVVRVSA